MGLSSADMPVGIVTGAGSGIGRATAIMLAEAGYRVVLVGRRPEPLEETASVIASAGSEEDQALVLSCDITGEGAASDVVDRTIAWSDRVDVLVNNAGYAPLVEVGNVPDDELARIFAVNTFAPARLVAASWPHFVVQHAGCVVNVSSMSAIDPFPGLGVYGAAKAAVDGLTRAIVAEGQSLGIVAYSVAPGAVETAMLRSLFDESTLPKSQTLDPSDIARVIVACVRGERPNDVGQTIPVTAES